MSFRLMWIKEKTTVLMFKQWFHHEELTRKAQKVPLRALARRRTHSQMCSSLERWWSWPSSSSLSCPCLCASAGRREQTRAGRRTPRSTPREERAARTARCSRVDFALWPRTFKRIEYMEKQMIVWEHRDPWVQRKRFIWPVLTVSILVSTSA